MVPKKTWNPSMCFYFFWFCNWIQDHLLRKKDVSCEACRSFAFPDWIKSGRDMEEILLFAKRQKVKNSIVL